MTETVFEEAQDVDVSIMRCPITKQPLVHRNPSWLETLDGNYRYPIKDGIFLLTTDSAILFTSVQDIGFPVRQEKEVVRHFYNNFGWKLTECGTYKDTAVWVDQRKQSYEFSKLCMKRVGAYLPDSGTYLLDAGSGPISHPVQIEYHANYKRRICVDLSIEALKEVQRKLGVRGIYVLGDVTNLPFRDDVIDAVISNHVLYHVPADEQAIAFRELWRVTRPGGRAVVVYSWNAPLLPKLIKTFAVIVLGLKSKSVLPQDRAVMPELYGWAHSMKWFRCENWPFKYFMGIYRVVSEDFMSLYLDDNIRSRILIKILDALQFVFPGLCGRHGQHPAIIIVK